MSKTRASTKLWDNGQGGGVYRQENPALGRPVYFYHAKDYSPVILYGQVGMPTGESITLSDEQVVALISKKHLAVGGLNLVPADMAIRKSPSGNLVLDPCNVREVPGGWRVETANKVCAVATPDNLLFDFKNKSVSKPLFSAEFVARGFCAWEKSEDAVHVLDAPGVCEKYGFDALGAQAVRSKEGFTLSVVAQIDSEWIELPKFNQGVEAKFSQHAPLIPVEHLAL